jgi:hypothetical protein
MHYNVQEYQKASQPKAITSGGILIPSRETKRFITRRITALLDMPPKRERTETGDDESQPSSLKRSKSEITPKQSENPQPTNKVLPAHISFPPRTPNTLRIASWNICSWASSHKKVRWY